jgi:pyruvate dehydrogenase E1 component alpha subunit
MEQLRYLDEAGRVLTDPPMGVERARELFAAMLVARTYDRKCSALQRQGRLATYAQFEGQEAAQIGSAAALRPDDWMVATYRDAAAMWFHGYPWENLLLGRMGDERGGSPPEDVPVLPPSITVGAHMLHAVGLAWAEWLKGTDRVAIAYFGDGATSEGDFHEAMNLAAVYTTPTVLLCENNGWAISMARSGQTRSETIAKKADAYGMPGMLVDGNDLFAVYAATTEAVARARAGEGPTLIEAVTYRIGPHTTTDDAGRYRTDEEVEQWRQRDPIDRVRAYLRQAGEWSEAWEGDIEAEAASDMEAAVERAEGLEPFAPAGMIDRVFAEPTGELEHQRRLIERDGPGDG